MRNLCILVSGLLSIGLVTFQAFADCSGQSCQQVCQYGTCSETKCGFQEGGDCTCEVKSKMMGNTGAVLKICKSFTPCRLGCGEGGIGVKSSGAGEGCTLADAAPKIKKVSMPRELKKSYPELLYVFEMFRERNGIFVQAGEYNIAVAKPLGFYLGTGGMAYEKAITGTLKIEFDHGRIKVDIRIGKIIAVGEIGPHGKSGFLDIESDAGYDHVTW